MVNDGLRSALPLARARKPNNHIAQGAALGYVLLPLRGVLFMRFDTLTSKQELLQYCFVGALLALASGKAERRQVHPLKAAFAVRSDSVRRPIGFRSPSDRIPFGVRSDSVRRPIRFRPPSDRIPSAVRSDCVRLRTTFRDVLPTIKHCTHAYLLSFNRLYS